MENNADITYVLIRKADFNVETSTSNATLAWSKYAELKNIVNMHIFMDGKRIAHAEG